jgi:hypothetical protein
VTVPREFDINPEFPRGENLLLLQHSALGVPTWHTCLVSSRLFSSAVAGEQNKGKHSLLLASSSEGNSPTHDLLHAPGNHLSFGSKSTVSLLSLLDLQCNSLFIVFVILYLHTYLKSKKISVVLLLKKIMGDQTTKLCDFTNAPNAQFIASPITSPETKANSFEVIHGLLNFIDQFGISASKDASMHLHDFCEICDRQKFKNVENDIVKLKLFPFSLRGKAKDWQLS